MGYDCIDKENMMANEWAGSEYGSVGPIISVSFIENYLPTIKANLQSYKNRILNYTDNSLSEKRVEYDNKQVFDIYKKHLFYYFSK